MAKESRRGWTYTRPGHFRHLQKYVLNDAYKSLTLTGQSHIHIHRFIRNSLRASLSLSLPFSLKRASFISPASVGDAQGTTGSAGYKQNKQGISLPASLLSEQETKRSRVTLESESVNEWEDVRCVICMESPHNAVLLQCSSFSKGCRAYMCDTSSRHSNCFKQYRRNKSNKNTSRCSGKTLNCPYCRGEVYGTVKSTCARRFMNARHRCCSIDKCGFSGTYSQLKSHLKAEHPGYTPPKLDPCEQRKWEDLERAEFVEMINARQRWEAEQRSLYQLPHQHPMIDLNFDAFMHNLFIGIRGQASAGNAHMPRFEFHGTMYPR